MKGNKTVLASIAAILTFGGKGVAEIVAGQIPDEITIMGFIGGWVGLFAALKGKRIETKLDQLNGGK